MRVVEGYYNTVLNIDYEKIDEIELINSLTQYALFDVDEDILKSIKPHNR